MELLIWIYAGGRHELTHSCFNVQLDYIMKNIYNKIIYSEMSL